MLVWGLSFEATSPQWACKWLSTTTRRDDVCTRVVIRFLFFRHDPLEPHPSPADEGPKHRQVRARARPGGHAGALVVVGAARVYPLASHKARPIHPILPAAWTPPSPRTHELPRPLAPHGRRQIERVHAWPVRCAGNTHT